MMFAFVAIPEFITGAILPIADAVQETIYSDILKATAAYGYLCTFSLFFKRKIGAIGIHPDSALFRIEDLAELSEQDNSLGRVTDAVHPGALVEQVKAARPRMRIHTQCDQCQCLCKSTRTHQGGVADLDIQCRADLGLVS
jgi:hypothetical protein